MARENSDRRAATAGRAKMVMAILETAGGLLPQKPQPEPGTPAHPVAGVIL
jgi:hypothetical protein